MQTDPFIGRKVTFLFGPLALAIATLLSTKAKAWFGVDVNTAEAAAFILSIGAAIITWLYNLGKHEVAQVSGLDEGTIDGLLRKVIDEKLSTPSPEIEPGTISAVTTKSTPFKGPGGTSPGQ